MKILSALTRLAQLARPVAKEQLLSVIMSDKLH